MMKLNLAPEVYQTNQRNKQRRRIATSVGITVGVVTAGILVVTLVIIGGQAVAVKALQTNIDSKENKIKTYADLQDAVTAQQHLASWQQLSSQKVKLSRFYQVLQDVAPQGIGLNTLTIGSDNTLNMSGTARSYSLATKFAKALEADNVQIGPNASPTQQPYFTDVTLSSVSNNSGNGGITFKLSTQMSSEVTSGQ